MITRFDVGDKASDIDKGSAVVDEDYVQIMYTKKVERMVNRLHEQE